MNIPSEIQEGIADKVINGYPNSITQRSLAESENRPNLHSSHKLAAFKGQPKAPPKQEDAKKDVFVPANSLEVLNHIGN